MSEISSETVAPAEETTMLLNPCDPIDDLLISKPGQEHATMFDALPVPAQQRQLIIDIQRAGLEARPELRNYRTTFFTGIGVL